MSGSLRLNGSTSGFSEITAPDVAGDQTFTLPAVGGTLSTVVYQQGIWTPTVNAGTINVYNTTWERIGDQVTIRAQINGFTTLSDSPIYVQGKPYLTRENVEALGSAMASRFNNSCTACLASTKNVIFFKSSAGGNAAWREQRYVDRWNDAFSGIWFQVTYRTDDTTFVPINGATIS